MSDTGLRTLSVNQMVSMLSRVYISLINSDIQFKKIPSVMLWGPPGVGKSQGVREIAHEIEKKTEKDVHITDVRLLDDGASGTIVLSPADEDPNDLVYSGPVIEN